MYLGTRCRLLCTFRDFPVAPQTQGDLADPDTVSVHITAPDGTTQDLTPVRDSVGTYHLDFVPVLVGYHKIRWVGTGAVTAVDLIELRVLAA